LWNSLQLSTPLGCGGFDLTATDLPRSFEPLGCSPGPTHPRVATRLIRRLQQIGAERGAWVVFVQADPQDAPAIGLYEKLGAREEVLHFDIPVPPPVR
jgi:hypothetical protein